MIRDNSRKVIGAGIDRVQGDLEVESTEAMAVRQTLPFTKEFLSVLKLLLKVIIGELLIDCLMYGMIFLNLIILLRIVAC